MKRLIFLMPFLFFTVSCEQDSSDADNKLSSLIKPNFSYNQDLFKCNLVSNSSLIGLESFFSIQANKYSSMSKDNGLNISILFPENNENVDNFLISIRSDGNHIPIRNFIDQIKSDGFEDIASCTFSIYQHKALDVIKNINNVIDNTFVNIEILRCSFNNGYNFGTFQIAINRYIDNVDKLDMPYSVSYIEDNSTNNDFMWINSFYDSSYQTILLENWINKKDAAEIKDEFTENATCIDSTKYKSYRLF